MRCAEVLILCVMTGWVFAAEEPDTGLTLDVCGLKVIGSNTLDTTFSPGVTVSLRVTSANGGLVQFDSKGSSLTKFSDEKGHDLLTKVDAERGNTGFDNHPKISADGKCCEVDIQTPNMPAKGSTNINIAGVVSMLVASRIKEQIQNKIPLVNGSKLALQNVDLTIDKVGKPELSDAPFGLTMRSNSELDQIADIRFFKGDGSEIKSKRTSTSRTELLSARTIEWDYSLAEKVETATIKVYIWTDAQKKRIPFELKVGAGL